MQSTSAAVAGLPEGTAEALKAALDELQSLAGGALGLQATVVAGAGTTTNIAVTGIKTTDELVSVIQLDVAADTGTSATGNKIQDAVDRKSEASITSTGNIQLSTTNTTGDKLLVLWNKLS